ncbi:MAG TPA: hypothetical protein VF174_08210 [Micromonosporaceae bacterium]
MKRMLWLGIGLAVGALVVRKLSQKAEAFTPAGIASSVAETAGGLIETARSFLDDVREGMAEREQQIHEAFAQGFALDAGPQPWDDEDFNGTDPIHPQEGSR